MYLIPVGQFLMDVPMSYVSNSVTSERVGQAVGILVAVRYRSRGRPGSESDW